MGKTCIGILTLLKASQSRKPVGRLTCEFPNDLIYRLCRNTRIIRTLIRGYSYGYHTYASFIARNFTWVLIVIVYITIVMTAMQAGLATTELQNSKTFNRASYGFTVFSVMAPLGVLVVLLIVSNLDYAVRKPSITRRAFPIIFDNEVLTDVSRI